LKGLAIAQDKEPRINGEIDVPEVRLVGEDGEQLGIVSFREALLKAED
jgi:translation initiation factor IF-3